MKESAMITNTSTFLKLIINFYRKDMTTYRTLHEITNLIPADDPVQI